ncbi:hypothetical protein HYH03_010885 [Edaphochlamys debaryana]|uniref:Uncharacterized protein n=1 Tax=Edaphochlamys debaryana TaxID=47281 RepID=A0A835Y486_9CHLO|nr:hypothetical protein HYH03_010885 [Edaphochlamys debaryana]|eukprot:KAG2490729.1 hypothetical protein HYH03_010885 [Edaphochlamys debaryana]
MPLPQTLGFLSSRSVLADCWTLSPTSWVHRPCVLSSPRYKAYLYAYGLDATCLNYRSNVNSGAAATVFNIEDFLFNQRCKLVQADTTSGAENLAQLVKMIYLSMVGNDNPALGEKSLKSMWEYSITGTSVPSAGPNPWVRAHYWLPGTGWPAGMSAVAHLAGEAAWYQLLGSSMLAAVCKAYQLADFTECSNAGFGDYTMLQLRKAQELGVCPSGTARRTYDIACEPTNNNEACGELDTPCPATDHCEWKAAVLLGGASGQWRCEEGRPANFYSAETGGLCSIVLGSSDGNSPPPYLALKEIKLYRNGQRLTFDEVDARFTTTDPAYPMSNCFDSNDATSCRTGPSSATGNLVVQYGCVSGNNAELDSVVIAFDTSAGDEEFRRHFVKFYNVLGEQDRETFDFTDGLSGTDASVLRDALSPTIPLPAGSCLTMSSTIECPIGQFCDGSTLKCTLPLPKGSSCHSSYQCGDGFSCDSRFCGGPFVVIFGTNPVCYVVITPVSSPSTPKPTLSLFEVRISGTSPSTVDARMSLDDPANPPFECVDGIVNGIGCRSNTASTAPVANLVVRYACPTSALRMEVYADTSSGSGSNSYWQSLMNFQVRFYDSQRREDRPAFVFNDHPDLDGQKQAVYKFDADPKTPTAAVAGSCFVIGDRSASVCPTGFYCDGGTLTCKALVPVSGSCYASFQCTDQAQGCVAGKCAGTPEVTGPTSCPTGQTLEATGTGWACLNTPFGSNPVCSLVITPRAYPDPFDDQFRYQNAKPRFASNETKLYEGLGGVISGANLDVRISSTAPGYPASQCVDGLVDGPAVGCRTSSDAAAPVANYVLRYACAGGSSPYWTLEVFADGTTALLDFELRRYNAAGQLDRNIVTFASNIIDSNYIPRHFMQADGISPVAKVAGACFTIGSRTGCDAGQYCDGDLSCKSLKVTGASCYLRFECLSATCTSGACATSTG